MHVDYRVPHTPLQGRPSLVEYFAASVRPDGAHTDPVFAAMVASLDESAGRILGRLDAADVAGHTIVIFVSDNGGLSELGGEPTGQTSNAPLRGSKGSPYEGAMRVPQIVRWPGVAVAGGVSATPVVGMDLVPTILAATDVEYAPPAGHELAGVSLAGVLADPDAAIERDLYWHYPHYRAWSDEGPFGVIRSGDLRLVEFFEDGHLELYDLAADLGETHDLATERPDVARDLHGRLAAWRESVSAQMPKPNPLFDARRRREVGIDPRR